jgi:hypothetical protein
MEVVDLASEELEPLVCPRCGVHPVGELYGPCSVCVTELRAKFDVEAVAVEAAEYEPKMNVTPNAVALKD